MVETPRSSAEHPIDEDIDRVIQNSKKEQDEYKGYLVASPKEGQDFLYEDNAEVKIENRTISFKGIVLQDAEGKNEKRLANISDFYVNRTDDGIQIFSTGETTPRLYLHNDGMVEGRANPLDKDFNIKFNGAGKLFETLRVLLDHDYEKYKNPEIATYFPGGGFTIEQNTSLGRASFRINKGNALLSGFILYNNKSQKWEKIPNITNFYIKKDSNNTLYLYSNDEDKPKLVINSDGIAKGSLPGSEGLSYGAKEHTALWKVIRSELNEKYQSYRHEKVNIQSEPIYINYITRKEEPKKEKHNFEYDNDPYGNYSPNITRASRERLGEMEDNNVERKSVSPAIVARDLGMLDEKMVSEYRACSFFKVENINITEIGKVGERIYINKHFKIKPKYEKVKGKTSIACYTVGQKIDGEYVELDTSQIRSAGDWGGLYNKLKRKYFS